ncbi:MAG: BON domain-containing protein [Silvibacterium sp.]|jgi:hypothetical protein
MLKSGSSETYTIGISESAREDENAAADLLSQRRTETPSFEHQRWGLHVHSLPMKPDRLLLEFLIPQVTLVSAATDGKPRTDDIHDLVQIRIAQQMPGSGGKGISVVDSVVTLSVEVKTQGQKGQAEKLAKKVHGVKAVVNNLVVANP